MSSQEYFLDRDIKVLCITATSFPHGVQKAHKTLRSLFGPTDHRMFYGISYPDKNGNIIYKAAAEEAYDGEAKKLKLETFTIKKGKYISEVLKDWQREETIVGKTFAKLLSDSRIDRNGYCLEIYLNEKDMRCLVPLDPSYSKTPMSKT